MVRNFGERRKKNKRGQVKNKPKSRKPRTPQEDKKNNEDIPQEQVTCREVAIYEPKPDKIDEKSTAQNKGSKNNNYHRANKREQRQPRRRRRKVDYDNIEDDENEDEWEDDDDYDYDDDDDDDIITREELTAMLILNVMMDRFEEMMYYGRIGGWSRNCSGGWRGNCGCRF